MRFHFQRFLEWWLENKYEKYREDVQESMPYKHEELKITHVIKYYDTVKDDIVQYLLE